MCVCVVCFLELVITIPNRKRSAVVCLMLSVTVCGFSIQERLLLRRAHERESYLSTLVSD